MVNIVKFLDGGTLIGFVSMVNTDLILQSSALNRDIIFKGDDNGSGITALTLDMSLAGKADFNAGATFADNVILGTGASLYLNDNGKLNLGNSSDLQIYFDATNSHIDTIGNLDLDVAGNIILDAGGGSIILQEDGVSFGELNDNTGGDFDIKCPTNNSDIRFKGVDGGVDVTALRLDMSDAGTAVFNHDITLPDNGTIKLGTDSDLSIYYENGGANNIQGNNAHHLDFSTNGQFRMRIKDDGNVLINKTNASSSVQGCFFSSDGNHITRSDASVVLINRQDSDGQLMGFANADSTEGNISISGGTVSFNGFSGSHWSRLIR
jgi:hypothetical protein